MTSELSTPAAGAVAGGGDASRRTGIAPAPLVHRQGPRRFNAGGQGRTMYTVAETVGHAKGELGLRMTSKYAGREPMEAKAACVRAVRLPT
jgi:hypothetical protein